MKNLLLFLVLGALVALTGVYCELWKIPGLDQMPTRSQEAKKKQDAPPRAASKAPAPGSSDETRPAGYYRTSEDSSSKNRARHLDDGARAINGNR